MSQAFKGLVEVQNQQSQTTVGLDGNNGDIAAGGHGKDGDIVARAADGRQTIWIKGGAAQISLGSTGAGDARAIIDGQDGQLQVGGHGKWGVLSIRNPDGKETLSITAGGNIFAGGHGSDGDLQLKNADGKTTMSLDGNSSHISAGGHGHWGTLILRNPDGKDTLTINAGGNIFAGGNGQDGDVVVRNAQGDTTIHIDGQSGDIKLQGADCAEYFDVAADSGKLEPGMVVVFNAEGALHPCRTAYDTRAAGIVSGAKTCRPGLLLGHSSNDSEKMAVALIGKAYCLVDANFAPIGMGDLLTTSPTLGHAMCAKDPTRLSGTIVGKSLGAMEQGCGLLPVMVTLR